MGDKKRNDAFVRLEWVRRGVSEYITELGNAQIFVESMCQKFKEELLKIAQFEGKLVKDSDFGQPSSHSIPSLPTSPKLRSSSSRQGSPLPRDQLLTTSDDNIYMCLYLSKLYVDFACFIEVQTTPPNKSENNWSGRCSLFKPLYKQVVDIALAYLRIGHIAYSSRFSKSSRLRIPRYDSSKYSDEDTDILTYLLNDYTDSYKEKYPSKVGSQASMSAASTDSSLESVCSNPSNPNHIVPFYFKMYVHRNMEIFWKYMCPANRYLVVEGAGHHPPSKFMQIALKLLLEDVMDHLTPKRQEAKAQDYVLEEAQMTINDKMEQSQLITKDIGKITMFHSQGPFKAVLSQCIYHVKNRLSLLNYKTKVNCCCERVFHFYLMHYDE